MMFVVCVVDLVAQDSLSLTLEDAIRVGLKNNVDIITSGLRVQSSEFAEKEAASNYLPKVTLNGSYNRNIDKQVIFLPEGFGTGGPTRIGLNNNFNTSIDLTVPIYSQSYHATRTYSSHNKELATEVGRGTKQATINSIRKSYFQALASYQAIAVRKKALDNALQNRSIVEDKLDHGLATSFDKTSADVKVKVAENNLLDSRKQAKITANTLKLLLGIDIGVNLDLSDSLSLTPEEEIAVADSDNLSSNSALRQSKLQETIAQHQLNITRAAYFPSLSAVGSYQYQSQQNDFNFDQYRWVKTSYIGLKLQIPMFNGMVTRNKVQQAIVSQKISKLQMDYSTRNLQSQMNQVLTELQYSRDKVELQKENVSISESALVLIKERYNFGKGTFIEVSSAELDLVSARLNYLQAILEYKLAFYDYLLLIGKEN